MSAHSAADLREADVLFHSSGLPQRLLRWPRTDCPDVSQRRHPETHSASGYTSARLFVSTQLDFLGLNLHKGPRPSEAIVPRPDMPVFTPGLDIRGVTNQDVDQDKPQPRPRGSGKLLSSSNGLGLALLRLEQVEAAEQGRLTFSMDVAGGSGAQTNWGVSHWRPEWWPQKEE